MSNNITITKSLFLKAIKCQTQCWFTINIGAINKLTPGDLFVMEQGLDVGCRARDIFPGGELINISDNQKAYDLTNEKLNDKDVQTLYEATFCPGGYVAKADIIKRNANGWHLIEVKSGVNDKSEYIDDIAYTTMIIQKCGYDITEVSLILISKDYRLGMDNEELFKSIDHTKEVLQRAIKFDEISNDIATIVSLQDCPKGILISECRNCEYFSTHCIGVGVQYPIFDIPRISTSKVDELAEINVVAIEDIPKDFKLTENQNKIYQLILSGTPIADSGIKDVLSEIQWPACYLDFETIMTAIPLYKDIAPYTQIPAQFSAHICSKPGQILEHHQHIADPTADPRLEIIKKLLEVLNKCKSIIVYTSFEKGRINDLAKDFPEYADNLNECIDRLFDFEPIFKKYYIHPEFHGKTSIKKVMPVLIPEMTYDHLEINEGLSATSMLVKLARNEFNPDEAENIIKQLTDYCELDTLAMVKVHEKLINL